METAPLKTFATWARTALIREVTARIAVVLAPASPQRVEQPKAVAALDEAITAAGGGGKGRGAVADRVAYTWFNRIIALRFMDANGYTGIGVVSPQAGLEVGQPEILAEAKRTNLDPEVVSQINRESVTALLNGTRRSDDPQGEAYALLLAEYCRHWNRAMPFMFERQGDFTELLMPANLLADDSVINRSVKVLTVEVCRDIEVIGWLYQFYISERKDEVFAGFKKNKKAGVDEIPAATQLFTPHWVVRYLVENSLGRLWMLNRPASRLIDRMDYFVDCADEEESEVLRVSRPEELKMIDPACGSGHLLTYAFDLLYAIYEEEGYPPAEIPSQILSNNLYGTEIDPRAGALAAFALAMKARERHRTFFGKAIAPQILVFEPVRFTGEELGILLTPEGDREAETAFWNSFSTADFLGSLICPTKPPADRLEYHLTLLAHSAQQDLFVSEILERARKVLLQADFLQQRYHILVANPPYMGAKNMGPELAQYAAIEYPNSKSDLMTMFMDRACDLVKINGLWGMINLPSWTSLPTFKDFRAKLLDSVEFQSFIGLGRGVFGSDFGSVAFTLINNAPRDNAQGTYRRLFTNHVDVRSNETIRGLFLDSEFNRFNVSQSLFRALPGSIIAYSAPTWLQSLMLSQRRISDYGDAKQGIISGDVGRFVRYWHEVSWDRICISAESRAQSEASKKRWFPLNSGGDFRKWYGNQLLVIDWESDGYAIRNFFDSEGRLRSRPQNLDYIFRESVSWSAVTSGAPAFRYYPKGFVFDNAGMSLFISDPEIQLKALGFLNSSTARELLKQLSPTLNLNAGQIADLPVGELLIGVDSSLVARLVEIARSDWAAVETNWEFSRHQLLEDRSAIATHIQQAMATSMGTGVRLAKEVLALEKCIDAQISNALNSNIEQSGALSEISLYANAAFMHRGVDAQAAQDRAVSESVEALVSYAVGCMFGRYSLNEPGLVLADQGATLRDYLLRVPTPTFMPDADNVIPIVDGDWFEDDIVTRFRQFLRVAFGEQHFEENLRFVTEALGVKDLRDYFVKSFYKDHVQKYKKRPIYWMFSSPKGSFNALIYMHRYTPSTVSTVLNEYLREFKAKLDATLGQQERLAAGGGMPRQQAAAQKEADRIRKMLLELDEYEHDVLYPLASQQIAIDLDDGVRVNYPKFGAALKKIPGLEAGE